MKVLCLFLVCLKVDGINHEFHINYKISFNSEFIPQNKNFLEKNLLLFPILKFQRASKTCLQYSDWMLI